MLPTLEDQISNLHKRLCTLCIFAFITTTSLYAQTIYLIDNDGLWRLDVELCINEFVVEVEVTNANDIAFHPDGTLYGLDGSGSLFTIDTITGDTNLVYEFSGQLFEAMTCSKAGILYVSGRDGELWTFDPSTGVATLLGTLPYEYAGDLTFIEADLYMTSTWGDLIIKINLLNLSASEIVLTDAGGIGGAMYGIVTYARDCNNVKLYGVQSGNYLVQELDLVAQTSDTVCTLSGLFRGAATTYEYKASDPIRISDTLLIHPECELNNGSITLTAIGGTPAYQYSYNGNPFQAVNIFDNLSAGDYSVLVRDSRGCTTGFDVSLVAQNFELIDTIQLNEETCEAQNGGIEVYTYTSGSFHYSIDGFNFQDSNIFNNLNQGLYEITVNNDVGCFDTQLIEVLSIPQAIISGIQLAPTTCGNSNGSIEIEIQNGMQVTYSINAMDYQDENIFQQLPSGNYTVSIVDENGCTDEQSVSVPSSNPLLLDSVEVAHSVCEESNGVITIHISNGTGALSYQLGDSASQSTPSFLNLGAGTYEWSAIDQVGCESKGIVQLNSSTLFSIEKLTVQNADCGKENGRIEYELSETTNTISVSANGVAYANTDEINDLPAAVYELIFSDQFGCAVDTIVSVHQKQCDLFIANIFSPNGDGINDFLELSASPNSSALIKAFLIFDRWGNVLHSIQNVQVTDQQVLWDGKSKDKEVNPGVFTYVLELQTEGSETKSYKGDITLVR